MFFLANTNSESKLHVGVYPFPWASANLGRQGFSAPFQNDELRLNTVIC